MLLSFLILPDLILAAAKAGWHVWAEAAICCLHMGLTQGLAAAMAADTSHHDFRGTAFGIFSLAMGMTVLFSNLTADWLWDLYGAPTTFYVGATLAGCALIGFLFFR